MSLYFHATMGLVGMGNRTPNVPKSPVTIFVNRVDCVANGGTTLRIHCPMKFIFPYLEEVGGGGEWRCVPSNL